jgi:hypothetical protein
MGGIFWGLNPGMGQDFLHSGLALEPTESPVQWVQALFFSIEWLGHGAWC